MAQKEYTIEYANSDIESAVDKIIANHPGSYRLIRKDATLHSTTLECRTGITWGNTLEIATEPIGSGKTKVRIDSGPIGYSGLAVQQSNANFHANQFSDFLSKYLTGDVNTKGIAEAAGSKMTLATWLWIAAILLGGAMAYYAIIQ